MPLSSPAHLSTVIQLAIAFRPQRILDVGVGIGAYGLLLRQYLDIASERIPKNTWQARIEGVEIFEPYRNPVWAYAYDEVHMGDVRQRLADLGEYDLVICNDVLEHFPLAEAQQLTDSLLQRGRILIATSPSGDYPQGAWGNNEAETHHCLIGPTDLPGVVCCLPVGITNCFVCTRRPELVYSILTAADNCPGYAAPQPMKLWHRARRQLRQRQWLQRNATRSS